MAAHASTPGASARVVAGVASVSAIGKYRVIRELGRGSMACVYEAEHGQLGKRVAIKLLHPHLRVQPVATERFLREGRFAARLDHPHIVGVTDVEFEAAEGPHLVMELVDGPSLAALLLAERKLDVARATDLLLPVFSAISHAHAAGIVHRDLKPANIIVGARASELVPKVTDFGVGRVIESLGEGPLTLDGGLVGSLPYMAPEQVVEARAVDGRADQYALAAILYELTTGRCPFVDTTTYELMRAIGAGDYTPAHEMSAQVPRAFSDVLKRAMSVHPEERYPSVDAFARELLPFASPRAWVRWSRDLGGAQGRSQTLDEAAPVAGHGPVGSSTRVNGGTPSSRTKIARGFATVVALLAAAFVGHMTANPLPARPAGPIEGASTRVLPMTEAPSAVSPSSSPPNSSPSAPPAAAAPPRGTGSPREIESAAIVPAASNSPPRAHRSIKAPIVPEAPSASVSPTKDQYGKNRAPILE